MPAPERLQALRNLPTEILKTLSLEELNAFLYDEEWPDSLRDKLNNYLSE